MEHTYQAAGHLVKRFAKDRMGDSYSLPPWAAAVVLLTTVVFLPMFFFVEYTLKSIYPTLAMVEDAHPSYEPVALNEEAADGSEPVTPAPPARATTSSLRAINRLLYSLGGWRSSFRGLLCALAIGFATMIISGIFSAIPWVGSYLGALLASLALVQLETAWVHIVISGPNKLPFYRRLPPFKRTFEATCFPVFFAWAAETVLRIIPIAMASGLNLPLWTPEDGNTVPRDPGAVWKVPVIGVTTLVAALLLLIPARVVLVRVQASLLSPDEDPIVSFDRSFDGKVEPAIVDGKGYVTARDALKTFSRSSWQRLYVLYIKTVLVSLAVWFVFLAILVPEVMFMARAKKSD